MSLLAVSGASAENVTAPPLTENITFQTGGFLTSWEMKIQDENQDAAPFLLSNPLTEENPPVAQAFPLKHGKSYQVSMRCLDSIEWCMWFFPGEPMGKWYCWESLVDDKPDLNIATFPYVEDAFYQLAPRNLDALYFSVGDGYWLTDNTAGLFTRHRFEINGNTASTTTAKLLPVGVSGGLGVDDLSNRVRNVDGSQREYWVMAPLPDPNGSNSDHSPTLAYIDIPGSSSFTLATTCPNAAATPVPSATGSSGSIGFSWSGAGTANTSSDNYPEFSITSVEGKSGASPIPITIPLGVKTMKSRTVKVVVYPVHLPGDDPVSRPSEPDLKAYLDHVYGRQINARFLLDFKTETQYNYADSLHRTLITTDLADMAKALDEDGNAKYPKGDADIRLFLVDGVELYRVPEHMEDKDKLAGGVSGKPEIADAAKLFVAVSTGKSDGSNRSDALIEETLAHEFGHIILGSGHPDLGDGPAPLQGSGAGEWALRLMCSGDLDFPMRGLYLVKAEWDQAEVWLKNRPNGDR